MYMYMYVAASTPPPSPSKRPSPVTVPKLSHSILERRSHLRGESAVTTDSWPTGTPRGRWGEDEASVVVIEIKGGGCGAAGLEVRGMCKWVSSKK